MRNNNETSYENKALNSSADKMLNGITNVITQSMKSTPKFSGAVISRVNGDGTVNVYFPPDTNNIFTNISNQTPFELHEGDSVELVLKNGNYSNCWVAAKHGQSYDVKIEEYKKELNDLRALVDSLILRIKALEEK